MVEINDENNNKVLILENKMNYFEQNNKNKCLSIEPDNQILNEKINYLESK